MTATSCARCTPRPRGRLPRPQHSAGRSDADALAETVGSRAAGGAAGRARRGFCYPYGVVSPAALSMTRETYDYACAIRPGPPLDRWALPRFHVGEDDAAVRLLAKLALRRVARASLEEPLMRVMHVITGLRTGGAENQLLLLTRHTSTDPMVVALTNADEIAVALRAEGVPVLDVGMRGNKDLLAIGRLTRLMRRYRPDVVHVHLYRATLYGRVAAGLARVPVVVTTEHSLLEGELEGRRTTTAVRTLYTATERFNDATLAVSDAVAGRLSRWGVQPGKVRVVPNAVDLEAMRVDEAHRAAVRRELASPRPHGSSGASVACTASSAGTR